MLKKRIFILLTFFTMLFSLTSCDAHFGSVHFDLPWWVLAIPGVVAFLIPHIYFVCQTYECPACKTKFRPKWYEISVWIHDESRSRRVVKCPHCHRKGFCRPDD